MTDMGDAFAVARAIDGRLAQRETDYADGVVEGLHRGALRLSW